MLCRWSRWLNPNISLMKQLFSKSPQKHLVIFLENVLFCFVGAAIYWPWEEQHVWEQGKTVYVQKMKRLSRNQRVCDLDSDDNFILIFVKYADFIAVTASNTNSWLSTSLLSSVLFYSTSHEPGLYLLAKFLHFTLTSNYLFTPFWTFKDMTFWVLNL